MVGALAEGKVPSRKHFYKYATSNTANIILSSGKLRWSAPELFNDPFDHQVTYKFQYALQELVDELLKVQQAIIFGPEEPQFAIQTPLGVMCSLLRGKFADGVHKKEILSELRQGCIETSEKMEQYERELNKQALASISQFRVLCLSETHRNVVMWSHYADEHKGAVLKLNCIENVDDTILLARRVKYVKNFPSFLTIEDWVNHIFGLRPIDIPKMLMDLAYYKHKNWKYEREWRVAMPSHEHDRVIDVQHHHPIFGSLYLGCRMPAQEQNKLITTARSNYPDMKIYRAMQSEKAFTLKFEEV